VAKIEKGDVVELKSGGPEMTVTMKAIGGDWVCQWFEGQKLVVASFPPEGLRKVK